jgi:hypothetical protein
MTLALAGGEESSETVFLENPPMEISGCHVLLIYKHLA